VFHRQLVRWISNTALPRGKPFFAYVAPDAPHAHYDIPPDHKDDFTGVEAPRQPSFDEADVSDKPSYVANLAPLTDDDVSRIDTRYQDRLKMTLGIDDIVKDVVGTLRSAGQLANTYIIVTSDNGYEQGEHRITSGKVVPYEESIKEALYIRGPGIRAGTHVSQLALNTDLYETFADIAGTPDTRDGRSLLPLLKGQSPAWRNNILIESLVGGAKEGDEVPVPAYAGVRTHRYKYIEYPATGEKELYDLANDPYELNNLEKTQSSVDDSALAAKLAALKTCSGQSCHDAEDAP
jgi:arylsulfatase A-like enzyme